MGDPKSKKKKYKKPAHPWQKTRIEEEIVLLKAYGLKNKRELWKVGSLLKKFTRQAKRLIALTSPQGEAERASLLKRLASLGAIKEGSKIEDILAVSLGNFLERRIQTLVHKKNLAKSVRQARQFIVHEHVVVNDRKITDPSYLVSVAEEDKISFAPNSPLSRQDHPERVVGVKSEKTKAKEERKSEGRDKRRKRWGWRAKGGMGRRENRPREEKQKGEMKKEGAEK